MKRILLPALALLLAGCGSAPESAHPQVRQQLITQVEAVKTAALGNDRAGAEAALAELNRQIATAQAQGRLTPNSARTILAAADRVAADVRTIPLPEPPPPVVVTVTPDQPAPDEQATDDSQRRLEEQQKRWEQMQKRWQKQHDNNGKNGN
ncbi:hypothetical protein [Saccharopolyspora phatthalungensis]|uniref:Ribosomal protein S20 n=1 Tax=Saccharopolyspora phatthalungensis TaxID=664693 RepID=A0A840PXS9_9PSEU|nr:hypothetical protein [Saccharopolyspora phatthalungensis]MBB5152744.1 ribosomal protein S20 [Saccharopolyspora phatthalungensis]